MQSKMQNRNERSQTQSRAQAVSPRSPFSRGSRWIAGVAVAGAFLLAASPRAQAQVAFGIQAGLSPTYATSTYGYGYSAPYAYSAWQRQQYWQQEQRDRWQAEHAEQWRHEQWERQQYRGDRDHWDHDGYRRP
jgi:hypothetical protein